MGSILTNLGAMAALKSIRSANSALGDAQRATSTGLSVRTARDNAAIWSVASVLRSDEAWVSGAIDSMALGGATAGTARKAAERVTSLLADMKERIVLAQGENVDRLKIDADVQAAKEALRDVIGGADFNGFNLLEDADPETLTIVTGANRTPTGLEVASIQVERRVMTPEFGTISAEPGPITGVRISGGGSVPDGNGAQTSGVVEAFRFRANLLTLGDEITTTINGAVTTYVVGPGDMTGAGTVDANQLTNNLIASFGPTPSTFTNQYSAGSPDTIAFRFLGYLSQFRIEFNRTAPAVVSGLSGAWDINVRTREAAADALSMIDTMIEYAASAAAYYGSIGKSVASQEVLGLQLKDVLASGRGALTDADMEDVAAKLLASQVRRDLAIQALSVANSRPETLLALFR